MQNPFPAGEDCNQPQSRISNSPRAEQSSLPWLEPTFCTGRVCQKIWQGSHKAPVRHYASPTTPRGNLATGVARGEKMCPQHPQENSTNCADSNF